MRGCFSTVNSAPSTVLGAAVIHTQSHIQTSMKKMCVYENVYVVELLWRGNVDKFTSVFKAEHVNIRLYRVQFSMRLLINFVFAVLLFLISDH